MTYNPNIPQSTDRPSDSQSQILANFTALNTIFGKDHVEFNASTDEGEHKKVTLHEPVVADPNLPDPYGSIYTKTVAGDSELFFEKWDNAAAANLVQQLTNLPVTSGAKHGGTQYTWLSPWGMRFTMGLTAAFSGTSTDTFITAFTTTIYTATATAEDPNVQRVSIQPTLANLSLHTENSVAVRYFVIGM